MDLEPMDHEEDAREPTRMERLDAWLGERLGPAAPALPIAKFVGAFAFLNAFVNLTLADPGVAALRPSMDVLAILVLLCALRLTALKLRPSWLVVVAFLFLPLRLLQIGDELMRTTYGRDLALAFDLARAWDLIVLMRDAVALETLYVGLLISALVLGMGLFLVRQALIIAGNFFVHRYHRLGFLALVLLLGLAELGTGFAGTVITKSQAGRTASEVAGLLGSAERRAETRRQLAAARATFAAAGRPLGQLADADVFVMFLHSYGAETMLDADYRRALETPRGALAQTLEQRGFHVRSSWLEAPVVGADARYAYASLASGVKIGNALDQEQLYQSQAPTLAKAMGALGHRTIRVMPATIRPWEEGAFFGFDKTYYGWELGYLGPAFGWGALPSQYVLDVIWRHEVQDPERPLFVEYDLVSAQAPFTVQPPTVEEWKTLADGGPYRELREREYEVSWPSYAGGRAAHQALIAYELECLRGYLDQVLDSRPPEARRRRGRRGRRGQGRAQRQLFIVLGDHPPPAAMRSSADEALVPLHVWSRDEALLAPFAARGYSEGLEPGPGAPRRPMAALTRELLEDFGAEADAEPAEP